MTELEVKDMTCGQCVHVIIRAIRSVDDQRK